MKKDNKLKGYESPNLELVELSFEGGILDTSGGTEEGNVITGGWDPLP